MVLLSFLLFSWMFLLQLILLHYLDLTQNQFDAMVSWVYNLGSGNLNASTLLKVLNSGDYAGVPEQLLRWNKAGGRVLEGLTRRRQAEADLFAL
jgi:GH24 family phage-related lysozyme (muramidase)